MWIISLSEQIIPSLSDLLSDDELIRLKMILRELYSDLDDVIDIEFNDMLKSII